MSVARILVLGGSGMLGSTVADWLGRDSTLDVGATVRAERYLESGSRSLPEIRWDLLDVEECLSSDGHSIPGGYDWVINAIGFNKQFIRDDDPSDVERAIWVNALFPHWLARKAEESGFRVLQIETDCVYSGNKGGYREDAPHDPLDVYGKTKSLGEVRSPNVFHLRCSIIGPELKNHVSLLDWFLKRPSGATVTGYANHRWNGLTSLHFARICHGIIKSNLRLPQFHHLVPADEMTKAEMLEEFATVYGRADIRITRGEAPTSIDRTLRTKDGALNQSIWEAAGFRSPQRIPDMIQEMRNFDFRRSALSARPNEQA